MSAASASDRDHLGSACALVTSFQQSSLSTGGGGTVLGRAECKFHGCSKPEMMSKCQFPKLLSISSPYIHGSWKTYEIASNGGKLAQSFKRSAAPESADTEVDPDVTMHDTHT